MFIGWLLISLGASAAAIGSSGPPADLPSPVVEAASEGKADVATVIMGYVEGESRDDPLVQLGENVWVKSSNYHGVEINGIVYYYCIFPHASFDPLCRGEVDLEAVRVRRIIGEPEFTIIIYTINYEEHEI
ncbi:MAG TPA: hypothetical protein EYP55_04715 [Anaerolineae bacterium]|nr:hypothetical protein [Anaerolineae bacterium]